MRQDVVTAGYIVMDVERLIKLMQQITNYIFGCIGNIDRVTIIGLNQINKEGVEMSKQSKKNDNNILQLDQNYKSFLKELKGRLRISQIKAALAVNKRTN